MLRLKLNLKRGIFAVAAAVAVCSFLPIPAVKAEDTASADPNPYYTFNVDMRGGDRDNTLSGSKESIPIVVPNTTINFKLTAGDAATAEDSNHIPLKKGVMDGISPDYSASFKMSDYSQDELNALRTSKTKKWSDISSRVHTSDQTYKKEIKIDFSNVKFTEPGVYHYILTIEDQKKPSVEFDTSRHEPYIDIFVYVLQKDDGTLYTATTASGLRYRGNFNGEIVLPRKDGTEVGKPHDFSFYYGGRSITVDKGVAGNMGDKNEYFDYTAHFEDLDKNMIYRIDTSSAPGPKDSPNDEYFISDSDGKADVSMKLKHGDVLAFNYLPRHAAYKISEKSANGYETLLEDGAYKSAKDAVANINHYNDEEFRKGYDEYILYSSHPNTDPNVKKIKIGEKTVEKTIYATVDGVRTSRTASVNEPVYMVGSYNSDNSITGIAGVKDGKDAGTNLLNSGDSNLQYIVYESSYPSPADRLHYINVRNGVLPTGIVLNNLPAIFGILSITLMAVIIFLTRKKPAKKK